MQNKNRETYNKAHNSTYSSTLTEADIKTDHNAYNATDNMSYLVLYSEWT